MGQRNHKIEKLLIANRGEIALRIQRACAKLGIKTLSVASEADRNSLFARKADELEIIGAPPPKDSYLNQARLISVAKAKGCNAVHPGYGFLSENAEFAAAVIDAGLIWVGPSPEAINLLGSKTAARAKAEEAGVPCTPGSKGGLTDEGLERIADKIGYPVIVKAVAGGGGRGMRIAYFAEELRTHLPRARAEAEKNFGSSDVFLEKFVLEPRHVEVQVFGDNHGNVVHFGTRDCSTQRRHQKLVEEAPAPFLSPALREAIQDAAVRAAKSVGYSNAGTAEFLVKGDEFYFLEMNTRIQVEHPVTEEVTGVDLVELQLRVAQGEKLPFVQSDISTRGHAIEFRIYAEDPANNFAPSIGKISRIDRVEGPYIREDFGFETGDEVTPYYDAMLSKVIVKGATREEAIERSREVMKRYKVSGLKSNIEFFRWLLRLSPFPKSPLDIAYLSREFGDGVKAFRTLKASEIEDPLYRAPVGGACAKDVFDFTNQKSGARYTIHVTHRPDKLFEAIAFDESGQRLARNTGRVSNGLATAVKAVIEEELSR